MITSIFWFMGYSLGICNFFNTIVYIINLITLHWCNVRLFGLLNSSVSDVIKAYKCMIIKINVTLAFTSGLSDMNRK